jgi:hypothetical protein
MSHKGDNEGESIKSNSTVFANKNFHKSPTYRRMAVKSFKNPDLTEIDARVMSIERMGDIREILFKPYEGVDVGSYLTFDGDTWLVYDMYGSIEGGKVKVTAEKCTEELRWLNAEGLLEQEYCVASATQLGSKANQGKNALEWNKFDVRLPLGQIFVFVQRNQLTKQLAMSQRFILGSNAYEITGIDDVTSTDVNGFGFVQITMSLTTKRHEKDDFVNKIAHNEPKAVLPPLDEDKGGRIW